MRRYSCPPNTEVAGYAVLSFTENVKANEILPFLKKYSLEDVKPDRWYPLQSYLDVINDINTKSTDANLSSSMVAIGMKIYETIQLPPEVENSSFPEILMGWDVAYQAQHRGGDVGGVKVERITDKHYKASINIPYPDDMVYGVAYGMARRFLPTGTGFFVEYDEKMTRRDEGGDLTVLHINWD